MKKFHYLLIAMLMALATVGLTACGDDEPYGYDLVGTWQMTYESGKTLIRFTSKGDYYELGISTFNGKTDVYVDHGSYYVSGNKLTIVYDDDNDGSDTIECTYSVQGNKITFYSTDYSETYIRVNDNAIEQYLLLY